MAKIAGNKRYAKTVQKVNAIDDVKALKKMIYGRNYYIKSKLKKDPEYVKKHAVMNFPPISDLRLITESTFHRLAKIKDKSKLIVELRDLIINTTRRKNKPVSAADYSNKEMDYLNNAVEALNTAVAHWGDDMLRMKVQGTLKQVTVEDVNALFKQFPDYWAISSGYYYAVTEFDEFMTEIFILIERNGVKLSAAEKDELSERLFKNNPQDHVGQV